MREDDDAREDGTAEGSLADGLGETAGDDHGSGDTYSDTYGDTYDDTDGDAGFDDDGDDGTYGDGDVAVDEPTSPADTVDDASTDEVDEPGASGPPDGPDMGSDGVEVLEDPLAQDVSPLEGVDFLLDELRDAVFGEDEPADDGGVIDA